MKKRMFKILLCLCFSVFLVACSNETISSNDHANIETEPTITEVITQTEELTKKEDVQATEQNYDKTQSDVPVVENVVFENDEDVPLVPDVKEYDSFYAVDTVNIRTGPSSKYEKVGEFKKDDIVDVIEHIDSGWTKIHYDNGEYYVYTQYLTDKLPLRLDPTHVHEYSSKITKPTCSSVGYTTHTCVCGDSYESDQVAKVEHQYKKTVIKPTCTKKGSTVYKCKNCTASYEDDYVDALDHKYVLSVVEPTYTEKGYDLYKCSVCKNSYKDNYKDAVPHEHDFKNKVTDPTCTKNGSEFKVCSICNIKTDKTTIEKLGHDYVTTTIAPTSKEKGYDKHVCKRCGDSYKDNYKDPVVTYEEVDQTVYATSDVNIRKGPSTDTAKLGTLKNGNSIKRIGIGDNGWSKVVYNDEIAYISSNYLTTTKPSVSGYPKTYSDSTCTITIYKEWYEDAYVYAAHIQFTDYDRLWVECAKGKYNSGTETTSNAAKRVGAIFAVNGDYATPGNGARGYAIARKGVVCNDKKAYPEGVYNSNTGLLTFGHSGKMLSELVSAGLVTDTFQFGPVCLKDGKIIGDKSSNSRAQRTFIGTNGNPGDIWVCVSDGRYNDGKSAGLNGYQCGAYMLSKGCNLCVPLDGGGSSTMYFNGKVLNAASGGQRAVADFLMFK